MHSEQDVIAHITVTSLVILFYRDFYMHHPTDRIVHTMAFVISVLEGTGWNKE